MGKYTVVLQTEFVLQIKCQKKETSNKLLYKRYATML
jgi:hypothetical protein